MFGSVSMVLIAGLLGHCRGENLNQRSPEVVVATAKQTATLPCFTSEYSEVPNVEWSKEGPPRSIIFFYMDGCEHLEMKNESFDGRTNIILKELKKGNISLMISYVQLTDAGTYQCMTKQKGPIKVLSVVTLIVVSEPVLSVDPAADDQVSLLCQVEYCSTEPDIKILDHKGNAINAESPMKHKDSRGCVTSKIRMTLQSPTKRVTCRVHHSEINVTKETTLNIPAGCMKSCTTIAVVSVAVPLLMGLCILVISFRTKHKMSGILSMSFTKSGAEDNAQNDAIEQLKAGTTVPLETEGAKKIPVVSQQDLSPTDKCQLKSTKPSGPHYDSSSKVCNTPQENNKSPTGQVTGANGSRSKSSTFPPKGFNSSQAVCSVNKPKGQHQSTPGVPMSRSQHKHHMASPSSLSNNPFHALADLTEEREQLLKK